MNAAILLEVIFIPVFCAMGIIIGLRRAEERKRRIAAYRASPESHILNLHD